MLLFAFYIVKVIICSGILLGYYWLLLRNKIFHQYNRFYLLVSIVLSLVLPLLQITIPHNDAAPASTFKLVQVVSSSNQYLNEIVVTARQNNFIGEQVLLLLYLLTSAIFASLFILVLLKIRTLLKQHKQTLVNNICFVNTTAEGTPFSFLKYIFWNDNIDMSTITGKQIFKHELAHVQQKHSYDKLFINAVLIFFWCNPFFWFARKELNMIHEFMADKIAVEDSDTETFAAMILQATYPQQRFPLTNPFFYSPIKRRLLMLTKNKNPKASYIGRVLVLPLAVLLFAAFTLKTKHIKSNSINTDKKITAEIGAGQTGKGNAAISLDGSTTEKVLSPIMVKDTVPAKKEDGNEKANQLPANALYVLDGKIQTKNFYLNAIDPNDIQNITVLKGESALKKYGAPGKNGVIEITTNSNPTIKELSDIKLPEIKPLNEVVAVGYETFESKSTQDLQNESIFTVTENEPHIQGGQTAWTRYILNNLNASIPIEEGWKPGYYRITVSFIVRKDGSVADIKTNDYPGSKTSEHCIDLIRNGPKWEPAVQNGQIVNAYRKQPLIFVIEKKTNI